MKHAREAFRLDHGYLRYIIAAVRLSRAENISRPCPGLV